MDRQTDADALPPKSEIVQCACPACGHGVAVPFIDHSSQPLATIAWPASREAARSMDRLSLDFVRCVDCGHVFNASFEYDRVPYSEKPNLMFNNGAIWSGFIREVQEKIVSRLPANPVVVEIGHGDGSFLAGLSRLATGGRFIGFDPHGASANVAGIELRNEMFTPAHLMQIRPDIVIGRHVLEHLKTPLGFLQSLSFAASAAGISPAIYFETPCIDRVFETRRTVDFYYEHISHFSTSSFKAMLSRCGATGMDVDHGYDGEVIFGFATLCRPTSSTDIAGEAEAFRRDARRSVTTIADRLDTLLEEGASVAVWGGTGKSAAFMCRYGLDDSRFPIVVDSDRQKVGTFVPGTGQEIRFRDYLLGDPVDVIIIPPQWRARDIVAEMKEAGIHCETVLIEHDGDLIDFFQDDHPYG